MIINGPRLMDMAPLSPMIGTKCQFHGTSYGLSEAGYDIRIKQDVFFTTTNAQGFEGPMRFAVEEGAYDEPQIGRFALASTVEAFDMPPDIVAVVHDKSTWARQGLSVFNTVIEPGWRGFLTLELVYHGEKHLHIPAGSGIAQVLFHELKAPSYYAGKYQDQQNQPVQAILG